MSHSGIEIDPKVLDIYERMRFHSAHKYAILKVEDRWLMVDQIGPKLATHTVEEDNSAFDQIVTMLTESEQPRYALYDFEFPDEQEGRKYKKLAFIFWSPKASKMKERMKYTANKDSVLRHLPGVMVEFQTNDPEDFNYRDFCHDVKQQGFSYSAH